MVFDFMENSAASPTAFIRGDINGDQSINISDVISGLQYLFGGGSLTCLDAANTNSDNSLDLSDAVYLLIHLFSGGAPPGLPHPSCGTGPILTDCQIGTCP